MGDVVGQFIAVVIAAGIAIWLRRGGVFAPDALRDAPTRTTRFTLADVLVGLGLWILGQSFAGMFALRFGGYQLGEMASLDRLKFGVINQTGSMLAIVYIFTRAQFVTDGGLTAWGVGLRRPVRTIAATVLGFVSIWFLLQGLNIMTLWFTMAVGLPEPPQVGHFMLEFLRDDPPRVYVLGVALLAVLMAPVIEEVLFRGLIQSTLRQPTSLGSPWAAILVTSAVFTFFHVGAVVVNVEAESDGDKPAATAVPPAVVVAQADAVPLNLNEQGNVDVPVESVLEPKQGETVFVWQSLVLLFGLSVGMGFVYEYTGSLWAPVGVHMMFNAANVAMAASGVLDQVS